MDDGAVVAIVHVADSLFQEIGYLYVGKFTLKRSGHIKNQIGVGGAFYHPEIVDGKAAIQIVGMIFQTRSRGKILFVPNL